MSNPMPSTTHSPLPLTFQPPWRVEKTPGDEDETSQIWVKGNGPDSFWGTIGGDLPHDVAAKIVTAVNCHAALVEALRMANRTLGGIGYATDADFMKAQTAQRVMVQALALVERGGLPE